MTDAIEALRALQPICPCGYFLAEPEVTWGGARLYVPPSYKVDCVLYVRCDGCKRTVAAKFWAKA